MGKRIALFVVLFLGVVLLVTLVARKSEERVEQAKPATPVVSEKAKPEVRPGGVRAVPRPEVRDKVVGESVEKSAREAAIDALSEEKREELARLKALRDEYDQKYRNAQDAMRREQLEMEKAEAHERAREAYELEKLREEDPEAYRETVDARRRERLEKARVENQKAHERAREAYELEKLKEEDPEAYREALEEMRRRELEKQKHMAEYPEMDETYQLGELSELRDKYAQMYREMAEELGVEPE